MVWPTQAASKRTRPQHAALRAIATTPPSRQYVALLARCSMFRRGRRVGIGQGFAAGRDQVAARPVIARQRATNSRAPALKVCAGIDEIRKGPPDRAWDIPGDDRCAGRRVQPALRQPIPRPASTARLDRLHVPVPCDGQAGADRRRACSTACRVPWSLDSRRTQACRGASGGPPGQVGLARDGRGGRRPPVRH